MTEKINNHQNYEEQTSTKEKASVFLRRRLWLGGAAIAAVGATLGAGSAMHELNNRSDTQLEIEQPSLKDQILDATERYDKTDPQIQYVIPEGGSVSEEMEAAAERLREKNEALFTYADTHKALALENALMVAHDIEFITGRGVRAGDSVTTWYDLDEQSFFTAATEALPSEE